MELYNISNITSLLERHGFTFSKGLGQNFIVDGSVCPRMASMSGGGKSDGVLEIGPGIGVLTKELAHVYKKVVAIELDRRLSPLLAETLADCTNVKIIEGDALKLDLNAVIRNEFADCERVNVCANLPYYITSPLVMRLLEDNLPISSVTVMVQKEAADRLCAKVGTRECGAVTVAVRFYSNPTKLFSVSRGCFLPSPNVDSAVIRLDTLQRDIDKNTKETLFALVKAGFEKRRKTLSNAITSAGFDKAAVNAAIAETGLPLTIRAENLTLDDWQSIAYRLSK